MIEIRYMINNFLFTSTDMENDDYKLVKEKIDNHHVLTIEPKKSLKLISCTMKKDYEFTKNDLIFSNGYQSWSETKEYSYNEHIRSIKHLPKIINKVFKLDGYGDYKFVEYQKEKIHSFTFAYIRKNDSDQIDFVGSYNEEKAFLIINYYRKKGIIELESEINGRVISEPFKLFDYVLYKGNKDEVLEKYFSYFGTSNTPKIKGYSSWYNDYQNISEEKMEKALSGITKENYDLFQIDDGYETYVGDWLDVDQKKFPNGLKGLVDKVHEKGLKAGIWLAPFVCETKSKLYKEAHEFVYQEKGKDVYAGCNWSGDVVLDFTKKEVEEYIVKCLKHYVDLGFDFFKLDFLYAACMIKSSEYTKAELMRKAMNLVRSVLKDKFILGCGVPLSSAFNLVDYCRIGPDVSLSFDDALYMRILHRERVSTKVTVQNTIYRNHMDSHVFRCDPDVYLLRDDNIKLNRKQKEALSVLNFLFGSLYLTSDNVSDYNEEKNEMLKKARSLSNATSKRAVRVNDDLIVSYILDDINHSFIYNTKKGEIREWR